MGRRPCCDKDGLKRGTWSVEEDQKLTTFILCNGIKCWRHVPKLAGTYLLGVDPQGGEPPIEPDENRDAKEVGGDIDVDQKLAENPVSKVETRLDHDHSCSDHNTSTKASREDSDAGWSTYPLLTDLQPDSCLSRSMEKYVFQEDSYESYWIDNYVDSLLSWDGINFNNLE
ncbi:hypothetical protein SADUNF_Sadunf08G0149300 [Salix dunnii]|uniref:Uncharacterized protein n=1 Tax=Salix dunnii TaxID=1413687 RepID=A0A835JUR3_9ROSI|nr:hypothetical protein SADUNF_Sadunf08G0149300 [Salix dunnii]